MEVEDLFKGPYVDLNLPFKRGMSLDEMIADGAVCKSFRRLGDMNFERLYILIRRRVLGVFAPAEAQLLQQVLVQEKQRVSCIQF